MADFVYLARNIRFGGIDTATCNQVLQFQMLRGLSGCDLIRTAKRRLVNYVAVHDKLVLLQIRLSRKEHRFMARAASKNGDGPIIIKKYANRRLYNTQSSKYITLDFLADLTRKDIDFKVLDAKTNDDITHGVLTQIIMEEENSGQQMLPVGFLKQLISMYGDSMQGMVPQFLESSMDNFRKNQKQVQDAIETAITSGPFGHIAKQNIEFMRSAREALIPNLSTLAGKKADKDENLDDLKQQMAALQAKIDKLSAE
jgi:polyhydroxyalkanoate synthesis repressor PhaR